MRQYYPLWFRLNRRHQYIIWYHNDHDGIVLTDSSLLPSFTSLEAMEKWAKDKKIRVQYETDLAPLDLDSVQDWLKHPRKETVDCVVFLEAWNLFIDLASSLQKRNTIKDDPENNRIYDKLFYGNNLPVITPTGKFHEPVWSNSEIARINRILHRGIRLLKSRLYLVGREPFSVVQEKNGCR